MSAPLDVTFHVLNLLLNQSRSRRPVRIISLGWGLPKFRSDRKCRSLTKSGTLTGYLVTCGARCHSVITYSSWKPVKAVKVSVGDYQTVKKVEKRMGKYVLPPLMVSAPQGTLIRVEEGTLSFPECVSGSYPPPQTIPLMGVPGRPLVRPLYLGEEVLFLVSGLDVRFKCPSQDRWSAANHALLALTPDCVIKVKGREMKPKRFLKDFRVLRGS